MKTVIGHKAILDHLARVTGDKIMSRAYCLAGQGSVGKRTTVNWLAQNIFGVATEKVPTHPDYLYLKKSFDEKKGQPRSEIMVGEVRNLRARLREKPWGAGARIAVIDEAEFLSEEAANALLKIVEEPPEKTLLFFLVNRAESLPETILSRTEIFWFNPVPESEIAAGLKAMGIEDAVAADLACRAWGCPGRALNLHRNPEFAVEDSAAGAALEELVKSPLAERFKTIEKLVAKKEGERVADELMNVLDIWTMRARDWLRESNGSDKFFVSAGGAEEIIEKFTLAKVKLRQNVNPRLIIENIFLN